MYIDVMLLLIFQAFNVVQLNKQKRDVQTSSLQNLNRFTKTYEIGQNIIFNTPNFTLIDSLLSTNKSKSSVREHTTWLIRSISLNQYQQLARYDLIQNRFILNHPNDSSYKINDDTGQLTLINTTDENLLYTEITLHAESGLSKGDEILHDIYRFVRLLNSSIHCPTNLTININESIEINCTIEYEFLNYDDLDNYQPIINMTFYMKQNDSGYIPIEEIYLNEINDLQIDKNKTFNWKRSIIYTIKPTIEQEYICIVIPDTIQDNNRLCRTKINIQGFETRNSSTVIFTRLNKWDLIDILIIILIIMSSLLLFISLILCLITRKRIVQIKPEILDKRIALPVNRNQTNNNEIPSNTSEYDHRHKPGCPKYIPSDEYNLLSNDLFTHTTTDNIKKIILPDIPQNSDLFDDETYIHFYIPSKTKNFIS